MNEEQFETLMSAQHNLETFEKQNPQVKQHPIYAIAKSQIDGLIEDVNKKEETTD